MKNSLVVQIGDCNAFVFSKIDEATAAAEGMTPGWHLQRNEGLISALEIPVEKTIIPLDVPEIEITGHILTPQLREAINQVKHHTEAIVRALNSYKTAVAA